MTGTTDAFFQCGFSNHVVQAVPEPGSIVRVVLGACGLGVLARHWPSRARIAAA